MTTLPPDIDQLLSLEDNHENAYLRLVAGFICDETLQREFAMRTRRMNRRRVQAAASIAVLFIGTAAFAGYSLAARGRQVLREAGKQGLTAVRMDPSVMSIVASQSPGKLDVEALATEGMTVNGCPVPLFGPIGDSEGLSPRKTYVYPAPVRVVETRYDAKSAILIFRLDWTAPASVLEEERARLAASLSGVAEAMANRVNLQALPMRSYRVTIHGGDGVDALVVCSAGDGSSLIVPPSDHPLAAHVPESMPRLRRLLSTSPRDVSVQIRASYDFSRVARGTISVGQVGSAVRRAFEEVVPNSTQRREPGELWVDRRAKDRLLATIEQRLVVAENNVGLDEASWESLRSENLQSIRDHFNDLQTQDLHDLIGGRDGDSYLIYTTSGGREEARAIHTDDRITFRETSEQLKTKSKEFLKCVQDVARKRAFDKQSHQELRDKFAVDGKLDVDVVGIFGGSAALKLDQESTRIADDDIKRMNETRDYWLEDSQRAAEMERMVYEKVQGMMISLKDVPKSIELFRLSERDIADRASAKISRSVSIGAEELAWEIHSSLRPDPSDALPLMERRLNESSATAAAKWTEQQQHIDTLAADLKLQREGLASKSEEIRQLQSKFDTDIAALSSRFESQIKSLAEMAKASGVDSLSLRTIFTRVSEVNKVGDEDGCHLIIVRRGAKKQRHPLPDSLIPKGKEVVAAFLVPWNTGGSRNFSVLAVGVAGPRDVGVDVLLQGDDSGVDTGFGILLLLKPATTK